MKKSKITFFAFALIVAHSLFFAPLAKISAQTNIVASYKFNPKTDGYGFENFGNEKRNWEDDLGAEDLIRMFGAKAVCKAGTNAQTCVMKAAAKEWARQQLEGMNGGHCEGMAVTALRMNSGAPFKGKAFAADFQAGAKSPFALKLDQTVENYIAYYFTTQFFDEIGEPTAASAAKGPVGIVKMLIENMKAGDDTYALGFYKYNPQTKKKFDGHAITPFAVEDAGEVYRIHVYDNNYPGETRYVVVEKAGKQTWRYVTSTNPNEPAAEYKGDMTTKTLEITPTSVREKGCFAAPFASDADRAACVPVVEKPVARKPAETPKPTPKPAESPKPADAEEAADDYEGETVEFAVNGEADLLVINGAGKRIGFDPKANLFVDEIAGANAGLVKGGMGVNLPFYSLPADPKTKSYTVTFSGKSNTAETDVDFVYAAPGFTVGFDSIRLDPNEILTTQIAADGESISFTASADGETPEIYFAVDAGDGNSYFIEVDGVALDAGKTMTMTFDGETGKLSFKDNDGNSDKYDVDIIRTDAKGVKQSYELNDVGGSDTGADNYEVEIGEWDGKGEIKVKHDEENNGFDDDEAVETPSEDNDDDVDDADDGDDDEDSDIDDDGQLNDDDADDDGDGIPDDKDTDDDGDGEPDATDDDDNEDGDDEDGGNLMNYLAHLFNS